MSISMNWTLKIGISWRFTEHFAAVFSACRVSTQLPGVFANTTPPCWCIEINFCQKLHFYWHLSNDVVNLKHFIWTLSALPIESFQVSSNEPTLFSICERDLRGERRSKSGRLCICQKIGNPSPVLRPQLLELETTLREAWKCLITYHPCIALAFHVV